MDISTSSASQNSALTATANAEKKEAEEEKLKKQEELKEKLAKSRTNLESENSSSNSETFVNSQQSLLADLEMQYKLILGLPENDPMRKTAKELLESEMEEIQASLEASVA